MLLRLLGPLLPLLLSLSGCSSVIVSRRLLLRHTAAAATAAALSAHPYPASAIVRGDAVGDAEAAAAGAVGLWIELSGCTVCRKDLPATCTGTLVAPDLVLSGYSCWCVAGLMGGAPRAPYSAISIERPNRCSGASV